MTPTLRPHSRTTTRRTRSERRNPLPVATVVAALLATTACTAGGSWR